MALGLTQALKEMSTRNLPGGKGQLAYKADSLTAIYEPNVLENVKILNPLVLQDWQSNFNLGVMVLVITEMDHAYVPLQ
jgi:hypothetical protein